MSNRNSEQRPEKQELTPKDIGKKLGLLRGLQTVIKVIPLLLIVVVIIYYILDGPPPFFPIEVHPPYSSPQPSILDTQSSQFPEPAFVILGEYKSELYTFNRGVKKVYAYNTTDYKERPVCKLAEFDAFWWHKSGKVSILSHTYNTLGSIYILDLTQNPSELTLITDRESNQYFPRTLSVENSLPMVWAEAGDAIAFVARDVRNNMESLFIFDMTSQKLIYTPARNLERISSVVWVDGDKHLALVAISDGQENRYLVDRLGGGFIVWNIID
jgi:hypothetical protein